MWSIDLWSWDAARIINAVLSALVVCMMTMGIIRYWEDMPRRIQRISPWVAFTYLIISYGSVSLAREPGEIPPGYRVGLMMINLAGLLVALLWNFDRGYSILDEPSHKMKPDEFQTETEERDQ